jgi:hypothetical protein
VHARARPEKLQHGRRTSGLEPPGWREWASGRFYLAYLRDPCGNKICAVHRG